jgi:hypothetical protein
MIWTDAEGWQEVKPKRGKFSGWIIARHDDEVSYQIVSDTEAIKTVIGHVSVTKD